MWSFWNHCRRGVDNEKPCVGLRAGRQYCEVMVELGSWLTSRSYVGRSLSGWVYPNQRQGFCPMSWVPGEESNSYRAVLRVERKRQKWKMMGIFWIIIFSFKIIILNHHHHLIFIVKVTFTISEPERKKGLRNEQMFEGKREARFEGLWGEPSQVRTRNVSVFSGRDRHTCHS